MMVKTKINGLSEEEVERFMFFMTSKIFVPEYINGVEMGGNDCDMDWMKDGMDISGEDMVHILFELYGKEIPNGECYSYELKVGDLLFRTDKCGEDWGDEYSVEKI